MPTPTPFPRESRMPSPMCRPPCISPSLLFFLLLFSSLVLVPARLAAQFSFIGFRPGDSLCRVGDVQMVQGGILRLSPDVPFQRGAIWHRRKQEVADGFTTKFRFRMGDPEQLQQADGIALVIQNADECALGNNAQGIGYEGIPNSLAVEFDTWLNEGTDPNNNHVAIHSMGSGPNRADFDAALGIRWARLPALGRGADHEVIVSYDGERMRVYLAECQDPVLTVAVNLDSLLQLDGGRAWVGLTSATGLNHQDHDLFSWEFRPGGDTGSVCMGDSVILNGPGGYARYRWSTGQTGRSIAVRLTGQYRLYVSESLICPELEDEYVFDVTVNPRSFDPYIFPRGPITLCRGDSVTLSILTGPYGEDRFLWSTGDTGRSITVNTGGRYAAVLVDPGGCEFRLDTVRVVVRTPPEPSILPGNTAFICPGETVRLWVPDVFSSYEWSTGGTSTEITVGQAGTYVLKVTDRDGCAGYDTAVVTVAADMSLTADTVICAGESVRLAASGRTEYRWSPAEGLSCTDCPAPLASPQTTTVYRVRGTNDGGCASEKSVTVTVLPARADAGADTLLCLGDSIRLHGSGDGSANVAYRWSPSTDISCTDCPDPLVYPRRTTVYYLQTTGANGCTALDSVTVTVTTAGRIVVGNDTAICAGGAARLSASGAVDYRWSPAEGLSCTDCPAPIASPQFTTTYLVIGSTGAGECAAADSVTVTVRPLPPVDAGSDTVVCAGGGLRLRATGADSYCWDPSPDLNCLDCPDPVARPTVTTVYYVTGINADGCERRDSVRLEVRPGLVADAGENRAICAGDSVRLSAAGGDFYRWEPADGLSCTDCPDPVAAPAATTIYRVTARNADGCAGTDSVEVRVRLEKELIPLRIGREYRGGSGETIEIGVNIVGPTGPTDIRDLELQLEYDPTVLVVDTGSIAGLLSGTILAGWSVEIGRIGPGIVTVGLTAPSGATLSGSGGLLRFAGVLYLSKVPGTEISLRANTSSRCFAFQTDPGYAEVDSICGLNFRLIELQTQKYAVPTVSPNPAHERVEFSFGLGLDGPTRLEVFDTRGNPVALIVDEYLRPGRYAVEWEVGDMPSGSYRYRLTSGDWSAAGELLIAR